MTDETRGKLSQAANLLIDVQDSGDMTPSELELLLQARRRLHDLIEAVTP